MNNLLEDGMVLFNCMYGKDLVKNLNNELDVLFNRSTCNGSLGYIYLSKGYKTLQLPTITIRTVNLLDIAIDIKKKIDFYKKYRDLNNKVTGISVFEEKSKKPLFWHTD